MASSIIVVDDLVSAVRSMLDEDNRASITDDVDILPALNRAQDYATDIISRQFNTPLLTYKTVQTVAGQSEYPIPEDAFEQKLVRVEVQINTVYTALVKLDYKDATVYETSSQTSVPYYYSQVGNNFRIYPASNGAYNLRAWYLKDPDPLVMQQGRINVVNTVATPSSAGYVVVDSVGSDLTTDVTDLNSYVNIIDAQTGLRKASFQIANIVANKITFKLIPDRTTVLNSGIDTSMTNLLVNQTASLFSGPSVTIEPDDYVCILRGTCVPFFKKPFTNFLIQYAVTELRRKLGDSTAQEQEVLRSLEQQVERSWVGREQSLRVTRNNNIWNYSFINKFNR